jgi:biopolymer transport protein ExbD
VSGGGGTDDAAGVDLTALMDILSNIIFFLMASFGAAVVAIVPASAPVIAEDGANDVATEQDQVTLTMRVKRTGEVAVSVANSDIEPEELAKYSRTFAPLGEKIDAGQINDYLWTVKQRFPKSKEAIINPEGKVKYGMLIEAMDASREHHLKIDGRAAFPTMFPAVVVSSLVE